MVVGSSVEQHQLRQKRPGCFESEPKSLPDGDRKRLRLRSPFDLQDDALKHSVMQFEVLTNLIHEIKGVTVQLSQFVADFAEKQELAGRLVNILESSCRICGQAGTQNLQENDSEGSLTFNDDGSQLPL